jgi:hypothetical protein
MLFKLFVTVLHDKEFQQDCTTLVYDLGVCDAEM